MATVADTIEAKFTASWSVGTQPTGYPTSDHTMEPGNVAEYFHYREDMESVEYRRSTKGYDKKIVTLPIEAYTRTSKDRLDAIVAEMRTLCIALAPGTYDDVHVTVMDMSLSDRDRKILGVLVMVSVTTLAEARA